MKTTHEFVLTLSCRDTTGIVHAVSGLRDVPATEIAAAQRQLNGWPGLKSFRANSEKALFRENPAPSAVLAAFGDTALPGERLPRNPNHHRAILALERHRIHCKIALGTWTCGAPMPCAICAAGVPGFCACRAGAPAPRPFVREGP